MANIAELLLEPSAELLVLCVTWSRCPENSVCLAHTGFELMTLFSLDQQFEIFLKTVSLRLNTLLCHPRTTQSDSCYVCYLNIHNIISSTIQFTEVS